MFFGMGTVLAAFVAGTVLGTILGACYTSLGYDAERLKTLEALVVKLEQASKLKDDDR